MKYSSPIAILLCLIGTLAAAAERSILFTTGFEADSGYDTGFELGGQNGWESEGSGGHGILDDGFGTGGQQAYVGFFPPLDTSETFTTVWQPIGYDPVAQNTPIVIMTTDFLVRDSTEGGRDDFRWTVYNQDVQFLFTLALDNSTLGVCYALNDGNEIQPTTWSFENEVIYSLTIVMDFENNLWSAYLNATEVVTDQPISTNATKRTLGDIGAGWLVLDADNPGNNFMLFDNFTITAMERPSAAPQVTLLSRNGNESQIRVQGTPGLTYSLEYSGDLNGWTSLGSWLTPTGILDVTDTVSDGIMFYRAREAPEPAQTE